MATKKTDAKTTKSKGKTPSSTSSASSTKSTQPAKSTTTQRAKPAKTTTNKPAKTTKPATGAAASKKSSPKTSSKSSKGASSQSTTDKAKKVASKAKGAAAGKGKILAATAGVAAAAAAAGVAYFRGTRGESAKADGRSIYHILPGDEGWQVKGADSGGPVSSHSTKKEALSAARDLAHSKVPSQLVVHKSDGSIQESWSYDAEAN